MKTEWYIKKGMPFDLNHFLMIAIDSETIKTVSFNNVREDIVHFIKDDKVLVFSRLIIKDLVGKLKFE